MSHWFRVYDNLIDDPKFIKLGPDLRSALLMIWCVASANDGRLPPLEDIAIKFRLSPARTAKLLDELRRSGFIDDDETGSTPHNWNARQFKSDEPKAPKGKDSYVYVIGREWGAEALKIGFSKNPWARITELQTAHHEKLSVLAVFKCRSHSEVDIHDLLKPYRKSGEWFSLPTKIYVAISSAAERSSSYDDLVVELRQLLRSATTEADTDTKTDIAADAAVSSGKYAFEHGVIRLTKKNFSQWKEAFSHLDLAAELIALSAWAADQPQWFPAVSGALAKKNRDAKLRLDLARSAGENVHGSAGNPFKQGLV